MLDSINQRRLSKVSGFTLIELMIAISILSLLLFTGSYSYSLLSNRWGKELGSFTDSAEIAKNLELTQRLISGTMPFVIVDSKRAPSFFFIGNDNSLLAVSQSGIFTEGVSEIYRLSAVQNETGKFALIYQSLSSKNILLKYAEQVISFSHQKTLFSELDKVEFSYFGYQHLYDKASGGQANKPAWQDKFSGIERRLTPEKIAVTLTKNGKKLTFISSLDTTPEKKLSAYLPESP